ncbi:MAG: 30S ribosomal protein S3 [Legionellales bacterium]|nr:30S ribosomal protein S3 [Legionellales bacterium]
MGQKVNPTGIRLGITEDWSSKWFVEKDYSKWLNQDIEARKFLEKKYAHAALSRVQIERPANNAQVTLFTARPGIIIGKKGQDIEALRSDLHKIMGVPVSVSIEEIRKPEIDAALVAQGVAAQLEKRILFRRAMKRAVQGALRAGAEGIKICVSGRLNGAEIARDEWYREGRVPLHTFKAKIKYGTARAKTTYGIIGVKVWICMGETEETEQKEAN